MKTSILNLTNNQKLACSIETVLSFEPFIREVKERLKHENNIKTKFYQHILSTFEIEGNLPIAKENAWSEELLGLIFATVSPLIVNEKSYFWALGTPVPNEIFYGTNAFYDLLSHDRSSEQKKECETYVDLYKRRQDVFIYKLILEKIYNFPSFLKNEPIYSYKDPEFKMLKYYRINFDTRFIDIRVKGELPELDLKIIEPYLYEGTDLDRLEDLLPLKLFTFEGFSILTLEDITPEQTIENIRSAIVSNGISENELYRTVRQSLKTLVEDHNVEFGLLPFLKVNEQIVFSTEVCSNSVLIRSALEDCFNDEGFNVLVQKFISEPKPLFYSDITPEKQDELFFLKILKQNGIQSYAIIPVFFNKKLAGIMEVYSRQNLIFYEKLLSRLDSAIPFIAQLLQQSIDDFDAKIEYVIKEKFTSLQPAVQWKFNEVAWKYLMKQSDTKKIEPVTFKNVYPLYGAVDIRNSTIERNRALQEDIRTNLTILISTLNNLKLHINFTLIDELIYKCERWFKKTFDPVTPNDEIQLNYFLDKEVKAFLDHLKENYPSVAQTITEYFQAVDETEGAAFTNRRDLELSMQIINAAINKYFETLQEELQTPYPCYFEKFRTDGVEYDIYIGQSLAPHKVFNQMYLKNLRLWQLKSMIEISKLTRSLLSQMPRQLETTQLIFIHGSTIDISFRNDERRFDVEGAYNIRYEVIKKRIDKVTIKDTAERLTQPGKIALVYFDRNEVNEYLTYIQYMQEQNFLNNDLEYLDLEELQGVTGLKAIRIGVNIVESQS